MQETIPCPLPPTQIARDPEDAARRRSAARSCGSSRTGTICRCSCNRPGRWPAGPSRSSWRAARATATNGPRRKDRLLKAFDEAGITTCFMDPGQGGFIEGPKNLALALVAMELAWVDGGAATCSLAGNLALSPIHERGTPDSATLHEPLHPPRGPGRRGRSGAGPSASPSRFPTWEWKPAC